LPLEGNFAAGNFIRDAILGGPIEVRNGLPTRSYLYAADLACWLWVILLRGRHGQTYNVGSFRKLSIEEMATLIGEIMDVAVKNNHQARASLSPAAASRFYVPVIHKAASELGLRQTVDLEKAIYKTAQWYRSSLLSGQVPGHQSFKDTWIGA